MANQQKSKKANPTMSSTADGSRITVHLPGAISRGAAEFAALDAAMLARAAGSRLATFGELAFCHPEESVASMVMEISAEVWVCQSRRPRELKTPSTVSELAKIRAAVTFCFCAIETILSTATERSAGVSAAVFSKNRAGVASTCFAEALVSPPGLGAGRRSGSSC